MIMFGSFLPSVLGWFGNPKVYSGPGADIVMESIEKVAKQLKESIAPKTREGCIVKVIVRIGKAYQQIIQLALEAQTDLVIMGVRGRGALDTAIFGSTTNHPISAPAS